MTKSVKIAAFLGLTLAPVLIVVGLSWMRSPSSAGKQGAYEEVYWQKLREFNYQTGRISGDLDRLNNQQVAIPGFVVPLDDNDQGLSEFLLVPSPKACIHVPPPPPNQMVMVKMKAGTAPKREWGPVWVRGILRIEKSISGFGEVSFVLMGEESEKYQDNGL